MDTQQVDEILGQQTTLIEEIRGYREDLKTKVPEIDIALKEADSKIDQELANIRANSPFYRLTKNQQLLSVDNNLIPGWEMHGVTKVEVVDTVRTGVLLTDRPAETQALLRAMGFTDTHKYISHSFNILKVTVTKARSPHGFAKHFPRVVETTSAAWVKPLSGEWENRGFLTNAEMNTWKLCGVHAAQSRALTYMGAHPKFSSDTAEYLIALPATVAGYVDLEAAIPTWGVFPLAAGGNDIGE